MLMSNLTVGRRVFHMAQTTDQSVELLSMGKTHFPISYNFDGWRTHVWCAFA